VGDAVDVAVVVVVAPGEDIEFGPQVRLAVLALVVVVVV